MQVGQVIQTRNYKFINEITSYDVILIILIILIIYTKTNLLINIINLSTIHDSIMNMYCTQV